MKARTGQAMLLTVLALGGAILGATTIAGTLMLYQIRATTDAENSAMAIFAADAGTEWASFDFYCGATSTDPNYANSRCLNTTSAEQPMPGTPSGAQGISTLGNGATVNVTCYDFASSPVLCSATSSASYVISIGNSLNSRRAFFAGLTTSTAQ